MELLGMEFGVTCVDREENFLNRGLISNNTHFAGIKLDRKDSSNKATLTYKVKYLNSPCVIICSICLQACNIQTLSCPHINRAS